MTTPKPSSASHSSPHDDVPDSPDVGTPPSAQPTRRVFLGGMLGLAAGAIVLPVGDNAVEAQGAACGVGGAGTFHKAMEAGVITDSLGRRRVKAGDYIYPEIECIESIETTGTVGTFGTPESCGVRAQTSPTRYVQLGPNWEELLGRYCPFQGSAVQASFYAGERIYISQVTYAGTKICRSSSGPASTAWFRTSGPKGVWLWSGGTTYPIWNTSC